MSPNHYFGYDDYGVLGIYYNGDSALYQFDDDEFIDDLGEWPLAPHVRKYLYDHIEENGGRTLLYAFDGGMENGIDEARGFVGEAVEAYIDLNNDEKTNMSKTLLNKLKIEQAQFMEKNRSATALGEMFNKFITNESEMRKYDTHVVDEFKNGIIEIVRKYHARSSQFKQDIRDESDWELPPLILDQVADEHSDEEDEEEIDEESDD
jgi:hypothetical protein